MLLERYDCIDRTGIVDTQAHEGFEAIPVN